MSQRERDERLMSFIHRHVAGCGGVVVEHQQSLIPGLTLRVTCHCGVSAEWWIPQNDTAGARDVDDDQHLRSA